MSDELAKSMQEMSEAFDKLCQERHEAGAQEYGIFTFLGNDVVRMMAEELADTANYCRMQFVKLMIIQAALEGELSEKLGNNEDGDITIGIEAFKGVGKKGWGR